MIEQGKKEKLTNLRKRHNDKAPKRDNQKPRKDKAPKIRLARNFKYYNLNNEFDKLYVAAKDQRSSTI